MAVLVPARGSEPTDPVRVRAFAAFFKRYMSISSVVAAALPIPVTAFGVIPTYGAHTGLLSAYTSLFCFLALAFIFYSRHQFARVMFSETVSGSALLRAGAWLHRTLVQLLPLVLIVGSAFCLYRYHSLLDLSVAAAHPEEGSPLAGTPLDQIPLGTELVLYYIGIFVCAEAAFIVMAIREYLQDLVGLSEQDLIFGREAEDAAERRPDGQPMIAAVG
ncbi:MAG TPA: hypothetical protein VGR37_13610 [Longimicrobiaceae bacterium]|nr:hypothetical protein [Longimicrobiaceae bacterium]